MARDALFDHLRHAADGGANRGPPIRHRLKQGHRAALDRERGQRENVHELEKCPDVAARAREDHALSDPEGGGEAFKVGAKRPVADHE